MKRNNAIEKWVGIGVTAGLVLGPIIGWLSGNMGAGIGAAFGGCIATGAFIGWIQSRRNA